MQSTSVAESLTLRSLINEADEEITRDLSNCISPFLSKMEQKEAELIQKVDLEGNKQKVIAEILEINYSTLKSRIQKARKNLGTLIASCCIHEGNSDKVCC